MGVLKIDSEKKVLEQLKGYKRLCGRIKVLERHPVGMGFSVSSTGEDKLRELHERLKGKPSYVYLNKREQHLEATAHAYLTKYPLGTKAQLYEVKEKRGADSQDENDLKDLSRRIKKVIEARNGNIEGYEGILQRLSELQDLYDERERVSSALESLADYKPEYALLLINRYVEGRSVTEVADMLSVSAKTFDRWRAKAVEEYQNLMRA